jgi:membrane protease YdiL (CAAX protease family)
MKLKSWLLSEAGILSIGAILTLIVLAESIFPPWAPYFIIYACLAIYVPLAVKAYSFGSFKAVLKNNWRLIIGVFVIVLIWDQAVITWLYGRLLEALGLADNPYYALNAALEALAGLAAHKFGISRDTAFMIYALFVVIWAPVGEELFYRGYIHGMLRRTRGFWTASLVSAAFFGIRHATHLFFLWPNLPMVAMSIWVVDTFVFGLLMNYLYEKTHSLYPLILIHVGVNIVGVMSGL